MTKSICAMTCALLLAGGTLSSVVSAENSSSHIYLSQSGSTGTGGMNNQQDMQQPDQQQRGDVDNTGRNERDRSGTTMTPGDQSENNADVEMTRKIRSSITDDDSLSTNAQNVKIISQNGKVTLRGPVNSEQERAKVLSAAKKVVGQGKVEDQLEVRKTR